jgi:hypothetical protein
VDGRRDPSRFSAGLVKLKLNPTRGNNAWRYTKLNQRDLKPDSPTHYEDISRKGKISRNDWLKVTESEPSIVHLGVRGYADSTTLLKT